MLVNLFILELGWSHSYHFLSFSHGFRIDDNFFFHFFHFFFFNGTRYMLRERRERPSRLTTRRRCIMRGRRRKRERPSERETGREREREKRERREERRREKEKGKVIDGNCLRIILMHHGKCSRLK